MGAPNKARSHAFVGVGRVFGLAHMPQWDWTMRIGAYGGHTMTKRFEVELIVKPKDGVRDPQGEAVQESLASAGHPAIEQARVGRWLRFSLDAASQAEAQSKVCRMCDEILVNPNLEDFSLTFCEPDEKASA